MRFALKASMRYPYFGSGCQTDGPYIQFEQQMPTSLVSSASHQPHSSVFPQGGVPG